jgi:rubrerythrin
MDFKTIEDIIAYAVSKEREAAEFYETLSKNEEFSVAKKTFAEFAIEERKHEALFADLGKNPEKLDSYDYKWIPDIKRSNYMTELTYEPGMAYVDILRMAMKREEQALRFYNDIAGKVEDEQFIKVCKVLAQEEAKHKNILETIYDDHMAQMGD